MIQERGANIFLDLKLHDIPNTETKTAKEVVKLGVRNDHQTEPSLGDAITYFDAFLIKEEKTIETPKLIIYSSAGSLKDVLEQTPNLLNIENTITKIYDNNYLEHEILLQLNNSAIITFPEVYDGTWLIETDKDIDICPLPTYYVLSGFQIRSKNLTDVKIHIFSSINQTLRLGEYATFSTIGLILAISLIWYFYKVMKSKNKIPKTLKI